MRSFIGYLLEAFHPEKDDDGNHVEIHQPSNSSPEEHWHDSSKHAWTEPVHGRVPDKLHDVKFDKFEAPKVWSGIHGQGDFKEPDIPKHGQRQAVGVVMVEPDKRVWVVHPTNKFGGYHATFPKGGVEPGLNMRENAIKEAHEESGLKADLHGHLGDFQRSTSHTRYYVGKRSGGHPGAMGWESQQVSLVPMHELHKVVTHPNDQPVIAALRKHYGE